MLSQDEIDALLRERHGYEVTGRKDRVAQVDAVLGVSAPKAAPVVERADRPVVVETAVADEPSKRGPGRPRKS